MHIGIFSASHVWDGPEKFLRGEVSSLRGEHIDWPEEAGQRAKEERVVSWTEHSDNSGSIKYIINYIKNYTIIK